MYVYNVYAIKNTMCKALKHGIICSCFIPSARQIKLIHVL